jgi:FkbM family methyltransferase
MRSLWSRWFVSPPAVQTKPASVIESAPPPAPDIWAWLASMPPFGTLIDIGANDGAFGEFLARHLQVRRAYFFEPQLSLIAQIEARDCGGAKIKVFATALGEARGQADFFENSNHPSSSLLRVTEYSKREFPQTAGERKTTVQMARLDDLLRESDLEGEIFLKIDVQGVEDQVIRGGQRIFSRVRFVLIEMSFVPFYETQPLFEEVHALLVALGFRFVGIRNQIDSPHTGQPLFAHCLYRRI